MVVPVPSAACAPPCAMLIAFTTVHSPLGIFRKLPHGAGLVDVVGAGDATLGGAGALAFGIGDCLFDGAADWPASLQA
jgi:hypothetical protein